MRFGDPTLQEHTRHLQRGSGLPGCLGSVHAIHLHGASHGAVQGLRRARQIYCKFCSDLLKSHRTVKFLTNFRSLARRQIGFAIRFRPKPVPSLAKRQILNGVARAR